MSSSRYYVVGDKDVWMIQCKDTKNSRSRSSSVALFAIAAAQKLEMRGERAHVCVLDDTGHLQCKWSYDRDRRRRRSGSRVLESPDSISPV